MPARGQADTNPDMDDHPSPRPRVAAAGPTRPLRPAGPAADADRALTDCGYLVTADPEDVIPLLDRAGLPAARLAANVYRLSLARHHGGPAGVRRQVLSLDAARLGDRELARRIADVPLPEDRPRPGDAPRPGSGGPAWTVQWATGNRTDEGLLLTIPAHRECANAVSCTTLDGRPVVVSAGGDLLVRAWDLVTGAAVGEPFTGHDAPVERLACGDLDGRAVVAGRGYGGHVWIWDLATGLPVRTLRAPGAGSGRGPGLQFTRLGGRSVIVTGADDSVVALDPATGEQVGGPVRPLADSSRAAFRVMSCTTLDGRAVLLTAAERTCELWDLATGRHLAELTPPTPRSYLDCDHNVAAAACTEVDGRPVAVTGCDGGELLLWDLTTGVVIGEPMGGRTGGPRAIACTDLDGRPVALVGDWNGAVRVWDLASRRLLAQPVGPPMSHFDNVSALDCAVAGRRQVAVTCGYDGVVQVWDLGPREPAARPLRGRALDVRAHGGGTAGGVVVLLAGGTRQDPPEGKTDPHAPPRDLRNGEPDGPARVWLPTVGEDRDEVVEITCLRLDGRDVAVTGAGKSVLLWDLDTGEPIGEPLRHTTRPGRFGIGRVECADVGGRPVAVSLCDGNVRLWDLLLHAPLDMPSLGTGYVTRLACAVLDGRPVAVMAGWVEPAADDGDYDEILQVWGLDTGVPLGAPISGHPGSVTALACAEVDGRTVAVTGASDGVIRRWDLAAGRQIGDPIDAHGGDTVAAVACTRLRGGPIVVSGAGGSGAGGSGALRTWDLRTGMPVGGALLVPGGVDDITAATGGKIVVWFDGDLAVLAPSATRRDE